MSNQSRAIFLFLTIVAVLFVSAVGTTNVYADDGTPPESGETGTSVSEEGTAVTEPADTVTTEVDNPSPDEGEPAEVGPVEVEPAETESAVPETVDEAETILEQIPVDTTVIVLDAQGEAQPLVSQESVDAILVSDPIWCPEGQSPAPGLNGCTQSYSTFTQLLTYLRTNESNAAYQQAGTIYVQKDTYTGGESSIDFNSYGFQSINNYNLTVHGGWDTVDNSLESTDTTKLNIPILIGTSASPWAGSLTLKNISINGVYNQTGLSLFSDGNITLSNVEVTNSKAGADLNAGGDVGVKDSKFNNNKKFGVTIHSGGNTTVTNSEFNNNESSNEDGFGMQVSSQGEVSLASVTASSNEKFGADINSVGQVKIENSVFSGNISYSYSCSHQTTSGGYGLKVVSTSPVSLDGVTADGNYLFGGNVQGTLVKILNSSFSQNGSGSMDNPKGYGLEVVGTTEASLVNVTANNNQLFGANVRANNVSINTSFFNGNKSYVCSCNGKKYYGYGLNVVATDNISMIEVTASNNNLYGAHLEGMNIAISGGTFSNNGSGSSSALTGRGLEIESTGDVSLANIEANNNQLFGANIQAVGVVNLNTGFFNGHTVYTYSCKGKGSVAGGGYGLQIVAGGAIALSNVEASDNYLDGASLDGFGVSVGSSFFNNNHAGLNIESLGSVSLSSVEANSNEISGATVNANDSVAVINSFFSGNQSYTYSSCKGKSYYGYGLSVITNGLVSLNNVTTEGNNLLGAHLEGSSVLVSLSSFSNNGTGTLSDHIGKGLEIETGGFVVLSEVTANSNQLFGANIKANDFVSINDSTFSGNLSYSCTCSGKKYDGYGLQVVTTSDIYLDNVGANENYLFGASLQGANVEVRDSSFSFNSSQDNKNPTGKGIDVKSTGDVLFQFVEASNNQLFGANVQADGQVNILSSVFAGNKYLTYSSCKGTKSAGYGLKVVATGPIFLGSSPDDLSNSGVQAYENGAEGAILNGESTVEVSDSSFYDNGASGLTITAKENVTLTNVTATGNGQDGVNVTGVCTNTVYVNGGTFADNDGYGIKVVNSTYTPDGTQTFANNSSGNVFQDSSTCFSTGNSGNSNQNGSGSGGNHYGYGSWSWWYWYSHRH